jgi:hypothetical protein
MLEIIRRIKIKLNKNETVAIEPGKLNDVPRQARVV